MKKVILFIFIIGLFIVGYYLFFYDKKEDYTFLDELEDKTFYVNNYSIFGTHLNIESCIDINLDGTLELVLKNQDEEIIVKSVFTNDEETCFKTFEKNNDGIYLDSLKEGEYALLVKQSIDDVNKYYSLKNNTNYGDLTYYTITNNNKNNEIEIGYKSYIDTEYLNIKIMDSTLPKDVYDITIDPGHGGKDPGASYKYNGKVYLESDLTLKIALLLKKDLENLGLKVKLTRVSDTTLENYGDEGRAIIPNSTNSKYSLSLHLNSISGYMNYGGVEVYTPNDINYDFASILASNISKIVGYSRKSTNKVGDGIYYQYFTKEEIEEYKKSLLDEELIPYDIIPLSPYMFMIREVGGISTHAYVDGRNPNLGYNKYYNSNQTAEPYLLELGYINYVKDLENLTERSELFSKAIKDAIIEYLNIS